MSVLVTGATGFVGAAVARALLERGETVRVMTRPASDRRNIDGLDVEIVHADLTAPETLGTAVAGMKALYHVAADYRLWVRDARVLYRTNVEGSVALMHAAMNAGVERIVYTSSVATLGLNSDGLPADEETPVTLAKMVGHYKRSKFLAEEAVRSLVRDEGLPAVIVNPSTPVGPGDVKPTPTGRMIREAATGRMPAYVDTGLNIVHVADVAQGHLLAFEKGIVGERYILGGEDMELRDLLARIARFTGRPEPKVRLPRAPLYPLALVAEGWARLAGGGEPMLTVDALKMARKKMFFSSAKAKAALGYAPRPADEALRDAVAYFGVPLAETS